MNIIADGRTIAVREGETLLTALLSAGIEVPNLCHLPELEAYGGCGLCLVEIKGMPRPVRACAIQPTEGMEITTHSPRIDRSRQTALALLLSDHRGDCRPPCHLACPGGQDCQGYIGLLAEGHTAEAFQLIMEDNPLPGCIGRVCPHPCEEACRRQLLEAPLSLMRLKRFAADTVGAEFVPEKAAATGKRVAIIGAGPAGLSCAYFLARKGHAVEVYEQMPHPGGMLRYGIPAYRLSKDVIDQEVKRIAGLGVAFHYEKKLGRDVTLDALRADHDAVFVAVGAWESSALGCEGDKLPGVLGGIDFLEAVARGEAPDIGQRVAIVGGGNTAMDAARTAIRLGAKSVSLLYRRTRREMPAEPLEIEEAEEEGVALHFLLAPEKVIEQNGRAAGLRLAQMALGAPDASGRRRPEPTGEVIDMPFDTIIAAIGQKVRPEGIEPLEKHRWRTIRTNPETYETSLPGVFAGGDAINDGPGIAIAAIGHGKQAAAAIDGYLQGEIIPVRKPFYVEQKGIEKEDLPEVPEVARVPLGAAPAEERVQHFNEFVPVLTAEEAQREASRCLECGCCDLYDCRLLPLLQAYHADAQGIHGRARKNAPDRSHPAIWRDENKCVLCGLCVRVCADQVGAAALAFDGRGFDTAAEPAFHWPLFDSDCISCGRCADLCPTGALQARKPFEKSPPLPTKAEEITCPHCEKGCRFTLRRYGEVVVDARPVEQAASCGIGRYAPLVKGRDWKPEQAEAIQKAMQGDLRTFEGDGAEQVIQGILGS